jgi:hypothetical protein
MAPAAAPKDRSFGYSVGAFVSAAWRGAESTRKSHSYEDRVAERGFNTMIHVAWVIVVVVLKNFFF